MKTFFTLSKRFGWLKKSTIWIIYIIQIIEAAYLHVKSYYLAIEEAGEEGDFVNLYARSEQLDKNTMDKVWSTYRIKKVIVDYFILIELSLQLIRLKKLKSNFSI